MKLLKKQALFVTLMATCAGLMCACSNGGDASTSSGSGNTSSSSTKKVTITWWNNYQTPDDLTDETTRTNSKYREYWYAKDLIAAFQTEYPNITVETSYKGSYSDIYTAANTALSTGDQPNIVSCYGDSVAGFMNSAEDAVLDMSTYAEELESDSDFNQNYLSIEKSMYGGKYYSLPYSKSSETLVFNQTMFDLEGAGKAGADTDSYTAPVAASSKKKYTIPETIYDLMDLAKTIKTDFPDIYGDDKQYDEKGYFQAVPFVWDSSENMFITMLQNAGLAYTDGTASSAAGRILFKTEGAKDLMVQIKKWNNEGLFATQSQLPVTNEAKDYHQYSSNMLAAGTVAMCVSSTAGARYFSTTGGFKASFNHPVNWTKGSKAINAKVISQGPSLCFFDKGTDANDASFTFYKYLTNASNSGKLAANTSYFPLRSKGYEDESIVKAVEANKKGCDYSATYTEKNSVYTGAVLSLNETYTANNNYFLSPVFSESSATRTAVGKLVREVLDNKNAKTDDEIKAAVDTAFNNAYTTILK